MPARALAERTPRAQARAREAERWPWRRWQSARARSSSRRGTAPLPSPRSAKAGRAVRARRARHPSSPACRSFGAFEVARVIHARHDQPSIALFDHGDRGILDPEWEQAMVRPPDDAMQGDLDHAAMGHDQDVSVLMAGKDRVNLGAHPLLEG